MCRLGIYSIQQHGPCMSDLESSIKQHPESILARIAPGVSSLANYRRDWLRAVAQLSEYNLIEWTPLEDKSGMGLLSGFARINDVGVKVLEAGVEPPIRISFDESRRTNISKHEKAPIAPSTPQQQQITEALKKVITAIDQADVSEKERNVAKSLLRKLLSSKAAAKVLGDGAQSLAAKYLKR